jgi:hypothetical protein
MLNRKAVRRMATGGGVMRAGAATPEELETLFEDTLMLRDGQALARLFEDGAVLVVEGRAPEGSDGSIAPLALARWSGEQSYVADPQSVVQVQELALIVGERSINLARRAHDGAWRYVLVFARCDARSIL